MRVVSAISKNAPLDVKLALRSPAFATLLADSVYSELFSRSPSATEFFVVEPSVIIPREDSKMACVVTLEEADTPPVEDQLGGGQTMNARSLHNAQAALVSAYRDTLTVNMRTGNQIELRVKIETRRPVPGMAALDTKIIVSGTKPAGRVMAFLAS